MATPTYYLDQFIFNSVTYNQSSGGPHEMDMDIQGEDLHDFLDDTIAQEVAIVDVKGYLRIRLRDVKTVPAIGTTAAATGRMKTKSSTVALDFGTVVLKGRHHVQGRANHGYCELILVHQSADGNADPLS